MFYSSEPEALRAFMRDKLALPCTDVGDGWLIFDVPVADVGVHPVDPEGGATSGTHDVSFFTDDLEATVADLRSRGVDFDDEVSDEGFGLTIHLTMPGDVTVLLYQPHYK